MLKLSDTENLDGLAQLYEDEIGVPYGTITDDEEKFKQFVARVNLAVMRYFQIAVQSSGTWELDDFNNEKYAVIYAELEVGRRDYTFIYDEEGKAIFDIYKVLILPSATATIYQELKPADENQPENIAIINEAVVTGVPSKYGKRGNSIQLDVPSNYTVPKGIKILVNREPFKFSISDVNKVVGFPYHQEYFFLKPAYEQAKRDTLSTLPRLEREILKLEGDDATGVVGLISRAYGNRKKDEIQSFSGEDINSV